MAGLMSEGSIDVSQRHDTVDEINGFLLKSYCLPLSMPEIYGEIYGLKMIPLFVIIFIMIMILTTFSPLTFEKSNFEKIKVEKIQSQKS